VKLPLSGISTLAYKALTLKRLWNGSPHAQQARRRAAIRELIAIWLYQVGFVARDVLILYY
jgi:hypothetical protein